MQFKMAFSIISVAIMWWNSGINHNQTQNEGYFSHNHSVIWYTHWGWYLVDCNQFSPKFIKCINEWRKITSISPIEHGSRSKWLHDCYWKCWPNISIEYQVWWEKSIINSSELEQYQIVVQLNRDGLWWKDHAFHELTLMQRFHWNGISFLHSCERWLLTINTNTLTGYRWQERYKQNKRWI